MTKVNHYLKNKGCVLIGPNCPGIITPNEAKVGIMPGFVFKEEGWINFKIWNPYI